MPTFPAFTLTALGLDMQAQAETGLTLTFTRIALGAGAVANPSVATALADERMTSNVQSILNMGSGSVRIRAVFSNTALATGFGMSEVGVFAQDPTTHAEKLYAYTKTATPDFMPSNTSPAVVEQVFDAIMAIGTATSVTATIDDMVMLATKSELKDPVLYDQDVTAQTSVTISSSNTTDLLPLSASDLHRLYIDGQQANSIGMAKVQPNSADTDCTSFTVSVSGGVAAHQAALQLGNVSNSETISIVAELFPRCGAASGFRSQALGTGGSSNIGTAVFGKTKTNFTSLRILFTQAFTGHIRLVRERR